ncbi:hypothetical protein D3C87_1364630 [compost metagenome]
MKHLVLALTVMMMGSFANAATADYENLDSSSKAGIQTAVEFVAQELGISPETVKENFTFKYHFEIAYDMQPLHVYFYSGDKYCKVVVAYEVGGYCSQNY